MLVHCSLLKPQGLFLKAKKASSFTTYHSEEDSTYFVGCREDEEMHGTQKPQLMVAHVDVSKACQVLFLNKAVKTQNSP